MVPAAADKISLTPCSDRFKLESSKLDGVLFNEKQLRKMTIELAEKINSTYENEDVVVVGLLTGVFMFMSDLVRHLTVSHYIDFMAASSYGSGTISSGNVKILKDLNCPIHGKHVVLVDEMCDTGRTLACVQKLLVDRGAKSVKTCVLLNKSARRAVDIVPNFIGAECPDEFVVGYGMDYQEKFRSLPFVGVLSKHVYENIC